MSEQKSSGSFWGSLYSQGTSALQNYEKQFEDARKDFLKYAESAKSSQWAKDLTAYAGQATHDLDRLRETFTESARENYDTIRDAAKHEIDKIAEWEKEQEKLLAQNTKDADNFVVMADGTIVPIQTEKSKDSGENDDSQTEAIAETSFKPSSDPSSLHEEPDTDSLEKTPVNTSSAHLDTKDSPPSKGQDEVAAKPDDLGEPTEPGDDTSLDTANHTEKDSSEEHVYLGGLDLSQPPPILSVLKKEWSHLRESNSGKEIQKRLHDLHLNEQARKIYTQGGNLLDEVNKMASNVVSVQGPENASMQRGVLTRHQVMMNKLRKDREKLTKDPAVVGPEGEDVREAYASFLASIEGSGGYASASWQSAIDKQLENARKESSALDETYSSLVPDEIPDEVFWSRFLFYVDEIDKEEQLRRQLLSSAEQVVDEDEFAWDDDEYDDDESANATLNPRLESSDTANRTLAPDSALQHPDASSAVPSVSGESRESYDFVTDVRSDDSDSDWN